MASELVVSVWQECLKAVSFPSCLNHVYSSLLCSINDFLKVIVRLLELCGLKIKEEGMEASAMTRIENLLMLEGCAMLLNRS